MANHKTVRFTLAADVANAATFTVGYPAGTDDGDFENSRLHYIVINGAKLEHPQDIGLSFGDTSVTVTNRTGAAILAGNGYMTFFYQGKDSSIDAGRVATSVTAVGARKKVGGRKMETMFIDFGSPLTANSTGICASQSVATTTALLNGALLDATTSRMILDARYGRNVVAAWTGTAILTIVGKDYLGQPMTETTASGTSHTGKKAFKEITSITSNANITSATVGTGQILGLPVRIPSSSFILMEWQGNVPLPSKPNYIRVPFQLTATEMDTPTISYVVPGFAGTVVDAAVTAGNTFTTGGDITFKVGTTTVVGLTLTIADGATAGNVVTDTPTLGDASLAVLATDYIQVIPAAAFNGSGRASGYIGIQPTSLLTGTFVAGLAIDTKSTGTTNDVRGTYQPQVTLDGTTNFALTVILPEAYDIGATQYNA